MFRIAAVTLYCIHLAMSRARTRQPKTPPPVLYANPITFTKIRQTVERFTRVLPDFDNLKPVTVRIGNRNRINLTRVLM